MIHKRLQISWPIGLEELQRLRAREKNARVRRERLGLISMMKQGLSCYELAAKAGRKWATVAKWLKRFNAEGLAGLQDQPRSGRPRTAPKERLLEELAKRPKELGYPVELWTVKHFSIHLKRQGIVYHRSYLYQLIRELGYTLVKPRPQHYKRPGAAVQAAFKKSPPVSSPQTTQGEGLFRGRIEVPTQNDHPEGDRKAGLQTHTKSE